MYLGGEGSYGHLSEQTHIEFDQEVRRLLAEAETEALRLLDINRKHLDEMATNLAKVETLEGKSLDEILLAVPTGDARLTSAFDVAQTNGHSRNGGASRSRSTSGTSRRRTTMCLRSTRSRAMPFRYTFSHWNAAAFTKGT